MSHSMAQPSVTPSIAVQTTLSPKQTHMQGRVLGRDVWGRLHSQSTINCYHFIEWKGRSQQYARNCSHCWLSIAYKSIYIVYAKEYKVQCIHWSGIFWHYNYHQHDNTIRYLQKPISEFWHIDLPIRFNAACSKNEAIYYTDMKPFTERI